jgi:hypothetical protein
MQELILFYNYTFLLFFFNLFIRFINIKINIEFINIIQALLKIILFSYTLNYNKDTNAVINYNIVDYSVNNIIYIYDKNYELLIHHCITSICLLNCQSNNLNKDAIELLLLFTYSSPILSVAKICKNNNYIQLSNYLFGLFAFIFFYFRILLFSIFIYFNYFKNYLIFIYLNKYNYNTISSHIYYINDNYILGFTILLIYLLQLYWMFKIIKIIKK